MTDRTEPLFQDDAYLRSCESQVLARLDGGLVLDRTIAYAAAGGQPGDTGRIRFQDGGDLLFVDTVKGPEDGTILHVTEAEAPSVASGPVEVAIDWERRHRLMRMHTCLHLLCAAVPGAVTGGQIGDGKGRLDFDLGEASVDRAALDAVLNGWIDEDRPVRASWIEEDAFDRRPELVRTLSVAPPRGRGRIRLIEIEGVDLQACGGTHVRSTGEIGRVAVGKIENKGRRNRRIALSFAG